MCNHPEKLNMRIAKPFIISTLLFLLALGLDFARPAHGQTYAMSNLWSVAAGAPTHEFMNPTNHLTRGMAYNPATGHLLVASRTPTATDTNAIYILDSATGIILGKLPGNPTLITNGTFFINMIGVTDDGVIYVGNLTTDTTGAAGPFKMYRWANETAQPQLAYSGDPSEADATVNNRRYGDSLALRGTGANTQILLGTLANVVALLRTTDGVNFTATKIVTDVANGDTRWGLAWGVGNTFWAKQGTGNLKNVTMDLTVNTGTVTASIPLPAAPGGPLDIDLTRNLLAIVEPSGTTDQTKHRLRLFDISNPAAIKQLDLAKTFPAANANGNSVGAVSMRSGKLFALETNNGMLAYHLQDDVYYPAVITSFPGNVVLWEGAQNWTYSVVTDGTPPFSYQWRFNGGDLPGETNSRLTLPTVDLSSEGNYQVVVVNNSSSVTSAVSVLTVQPGNASGQVTNIWNIAPDTRPYLTSAYREYAVAINPLTTNIIVVTTRPNPTNMIAVLDMETGAHKHYIDYSILGYSDFNRVTVADDGTIFVCNFTADAASTLFTIYGFSDDNPTPGMTGYLFNDDPGNTGDPTKAVVPSNVGWGSNIDARGGGQDTEILIGSGKWAATAFDTKAVAILKYSGPGFVSTPIIVTNAPFGNNTFRFGLCWGPGNTFWVKGLGSLMLVEYDLAAGTGFIKKTYPTSGSRSVPYSATGMAFDADSDLLATLINGTPPTPVSLSVFDVSNVDAGPFWADQELFTTYNQDVEFQGTVSFERGYIVALGVNNGLKAMKLNSGFSSSLPIIMTHPASGLWLEGTSPTLRVVADSLSPLSYQWYRDGEILAGQTQSTLTLTNIQASQAGSYVARVTNAGGSRNTKPALLTVTPTLTTAQMSNTWSVLPGTRPYLNTGYFDYGMSFNPANSNLVIASHVPTNTPAVVIGVMDAVSGVHKHNLDVSIVQGGNRLVHKIGITDDGVIYAANRSVNSATNPLKIYRWADDQLATLATVAFEGDPFPTLHPNKLAGWTMDVRGAGINTEILLSTSASNVLSVLKTTDGFTFTPNEILVAGAPADFARLGICFGTGNTFWVKTWMGSLYLIEYDLAAKTGTIIRTWNTSQFPATITTLAYNDNLKMLAGAARDEQKNIQIFSVANLDAAPVLLDQEIYPTYNASIEANGALDFGGNAYLFGMNENNGVMAFLINSDYQPPSTSFKILNAAASGGNVTLTWESQDGKVYQVQSANSLPPTWQDLGSPVTATGSTATYIDTVSGTAPRFYRVTAQ
ncbi:MAG TPA: DUF4623 domain-containing protein [Clostridia bacterium]|nr:DUF4623 domain-containing protein [Clostridia bacterium]